MTTRRSTAMALSLVIIMFLVLSVRLVIGQNSSTSFPCETEVSAVGNAVFSDDFSSDPNASGRWSIRRGSGDLDNEASWDSETEVFYLTRAAYRKAVAMFAEYELTSTCWEAQFRYKAGGGSGADGLVFMFYKDKASYTPGHGGFLGFQSWDDLVGISGYGIEFDSFLNTLSIGGYADPSGNHIALIEGSVSNHMLHLDDQRTEDNLWHDVLVQFDEGRVVVSIDAEIVLDHQIADMDYTYSGVGFSSATGDRTNNHIIDDFVLRTSTSGETYSISGQVTDNTRQPIANVLITTDAGHSTATEASGMYTLTGLITGTHTLRPTKIAYVFTPEAITVELNSNRTGVNFRGESVACAVPVATPFLQFPLAGHRTSASFGSAARDTDEGGLLNSWFDHHAPTYTPANDDMVLFTSDVYTESRGNEIGGLYCWGSQAVEGEETLHYCYDNHDGYDIVRPSGANANPVINAAYEGTVVACCSYDGDGCEHDCWPLGQQVWVDHGNNYASLYGHLDTVSVTVGSPVTIETALGTMGTTGNSTGVHLHFGVYFNWNLRDPWITDTSSVRSGEVVDPFGWDGLENSPPVTDTWGTPSVNLWQHAPRIASVLDTSGGELASPTGRVVASIPGAALNDPTLMTLREGPVSAPSATLRGTGLGFWLRALWDWNMGESALHTQAINSGLAAPITVTVNYTDTARAHLDVTQLAVHRWDEAAGSWQKLDTSLDSAARTATAQTTELGAFDLQAPLVCPEDVLEPNDHYATASLLAAEEPIHSLFDIPGDEDWFRLEAVADVTYTLQTSELSTGVDTVVELYDTDAATLLARGDEETLGSGLVWTAPGARSFYVRVFPGEASTTGCEARFALDVTAQFGHQIYLPLILRGH